MSDRLNEKADSCSELSHTLRDLAKTVSHIIQKQRIIQAQKRNNIGDIDEIGSCSEKVCDILKISKNEFDQIMHIGDNKGTCFKKKYSRF
jgi:hypothetical protein